MFGCVTRRFLCALMSFATIATSVAPFSAANAQSGTYEADWRNICGIYDCSFQVRAPQDKWVEIEGVNDLAGLRGLAGDEARALFAGDSWMSAGDTAAGINRAKHVDASMALGAVPIQKDMPVWIVAKYFFQERQLRVIALKTARGADGHTRLYQAHYTPHHGAYHEARGAFVSPQALAVSTHPRGVNPFAGFSNDETDPVFYNVGAAAAEVAVGLAMEHFRSSHGIWIDSETRIDQHITSSRKIYGKKLTIHTYGYVKPVFSLVSPYNLSTANGGGASVNYAVTCPSGDGMCTSADELAFSGITKQKLSEKDVLELEENIYYHATTQKQISGLFVAVMVGLAVVATGGLAAGAANWSYVGGFGLAPTANVLAAGAAAASVTSGIAIAAVTGGVVGLMVGNSPVNTSNWSSDPLSAMRSNVDPTTVPQGRQVAAYCGNEHCQTTNVRAKQRHIQTKLPGLDSANLHGSNITLSGGGGKAMAPSVFAVDSVNVPVTLGPADYDKVKPQCDGRASCMVISLFK